MRFLRKFRTWTLLVPILLVVVGIGWRSYIDTYPTWREEVRLSDGRVITINQKHKYFAEYGTDQSWLTFSLPEMGGEKVWHSFLTPQRIDVYEGRVYVFGFPRGDKQFAYYHAPKNYMVAFIWNGIEFSRIAYLDLPEGLRSEENVYSCVPDRRSEILTIATKTNKWCPVRGDRWKFGRSINLADYQALARFYAGLKNTQPRSN